MAAKTVYFLACLALARAGVQRREAGSPLADIQTHAGQLAKAFADQLDSFASSNNSQHVNTVLKESSDAVLQQLSAFSASLQSALTDATGKAKEALQQARTNIDKNVEELRKAHPDVEKRAGELKDKIQAAVANAAQVSQKVAKEVAANVEQTNEKLAPQLKQAYDDLVKKIGDVQKSLYEAAAKQ